MIFKFALCDAVKLDTAQTSPETPMIKTASGRVLIEPGSDKAQIVEAEIKKHPTALFFRAKAIKADEENSNGDFFSEEELLKSYKTFENVPFFTNHDNQNIENARGKVIFAEWDKEEKSVYVISFVDRESFPHICRSIEEEYVTGVSMGCSVEYSVCNICGNKAEKTDDYCVHIRNRKGRTFSGKARHVTTGEVKEFKNHPCYEENYGIKFIELSAVVDPACASCQIEGLLRNNDFLKRVANVQNAMFMIKTAAIRKEASEEEIQELNGCIDTLEDLAVNLIKNKQVEKDFAADLVEILANLQQFAEELIGAGYGQIQSVPGSSDEPIPGAEDPLSLDAAPDAGLPAEEGAVPLPVSEETEIGAVGRETAGPGQSFIDGMPKAPQAPEFPISAPMKPAAMNSSKVVRLATISRKMKEINSNIYSEEQEEEMSRRRTVAARQQQKDRAVEVLSNSWKEKQSFFEYIKEVPSVQDKAHKLAVKKSDDSFIIVAESNNSEEKKIWTYEDLNENQREMIKEDPKEAAVQLLNTFTSSVKQKGDNNMSKKEAGANTVNKAPGVTQEAQLEEMRDLYHARTGEEQNSVTEKQLADNPGTHVRQGEKDVTTEKQLDEKVKLHPRENNIPEVTQEAQLNTTDAASPRTEKEWNEITQQQLSTEKMRVDNEPEVVTEKQLNDVDAPWARAAGRDASQFKSASEHLDSVVSVLAESVIATGCTPEEITKLASSMVSTVKSRYDLADKILSPAEKNEAVDYATRLAYWGNKNLKVAGASSDQISTLVISGLQKVASDETINPDVLIDAIDVVSEGEQGLQTVNEKVDEIMSEREEVVEEVSVRDELRQALQANVEKKDSKESRNEERQEIVASVEKEEKAVSIREAERSKWVKKVGSKEIKPDTMIEASKSEIGIKDGMPVNEMKKAIRSFAAGALAANNVTAQTVTHVEIQGETVRIAVQTDDNIEESVEIPVGEVTGPAPEEIVPEGDIAGEGLEATLNETAEEVPENAINTAPVMASSKKMTKKAQTPSGAGVPGGDGAGQGVEQAGIPDAVPSEAAPIQGLTTEEVDIEEDEIPTVGEQQLPYTICPECGASDVDVVNEDDGDIHGSCNSCGAEYEAMVKKEIEFKILNPGGGTDEMEAEESIEVPALPVAAQTRVDKNSIVRIAENKKQHGNVCPACGEQNCETSSEDEAGVKYTCAACGADVEKELLVNASNPSDSVLRVKWDFVPNVSDCEGCEETARRFASMMRVEKMIKGASANPYPTANCIELLARKFGGDTVASFGRCKGKLLAECACKELEKLAALTKDRHAIKLASVYSQSDPMDTCIDDHVEKGFEVKEAETLCGCLKKKFASEVDDNPYIMAFAEDVESGKETAVTMDDLRAINDVLSEDVEIKAVEAEADHDLRDGLPPVDSIDVDVEVVKEAEITEASQEAEVKEASEETEIKESVEEAEVKEASEETQEVTAEAEISPEEEKEMALAMQSHKLRRVGETVVKVAGKPKKIVDIEPNVEAGVPRANATMGNEGPENIDVPMAKPSVPRGNATMGKEQPPQAQAPDVAVDSSYMGKEKENQAGMPPINNEIRGRVQAETEETITKEAKELKEVDTVEDDVRAGVPRANAELGNESKDNINVDAKDPDVPSIGDKAALGKEEPPKAKKADVPMSDEAYQGDEKATQNAADMPSNNDEYLKRVQQEARRERIRQAREMEAIKVTAKLLAKDRIAEEAYEDVVKALCNFEIDKIASSADAMFPVKQVKTASTEKTAGHQIPAIVLQSAGNGSDSLLDKLASHFNKSQKVPDEE